MDGYYSYSVDKRTEVMDVKIDHLVDAVEDIKERQFSFDKQGTNHSKYPSLHQRG